MTFWLDLNQLMNNKYVYIKYINLLLNVKKTHKFKQIVEKIQYDKHPVLYITLNYVNITLDSINI